MADMNFFKENEDSFSSPYYISARRLAATTSIQTPNQLYELQQRLNSGVKNVELSGPLDPGAFEQIPKDHFAELRRLAKLSGAEISLHAPMFDISGFDERLEWKEENRINVEEQFKSIIEKAHDLSPEGNIPITVHTNRSVPSMTPDKNLGTYTEKQAYASKMPELEGKEIPRVLVAIDAEEGRLLPLKYEEKDYLGEKKIFTPHERISNANETQWDQKKLEIFSLESKEYEIKKRAREIEQAMASLSYGASQGVLTQEEKEQYNAYIRDLDLLQHHNNTITSNMLSALNEVYHKTVNFNGHNIDPEDLKDLKQLKDAWGERAKIINQFEDLKRKAEKEGNSDILVDLNKRASEQLAQRVGNLASPENTLRVLSKMPHPNVLIPVDDFVAEKGSKTLVNTALHAYKKYGENAPVLAIENWQPETALSRGETFQEFVTKTKNDFAEALQEQNKLPKEEAKRIADRLIGATWDVAHINMLRKYGYSQEDIIKEAKAVKGSDVKKLHLADNFGYSDSHLVTGMGNVPTFEQIEALEKTGMSKDVPMIGEFGAFDTMFKESSFPYTLENVHSPLYSYKNSARWGAVRDTYPDYFGGYGMILPDLHFKEFYGGGFSSLPRELGGQMGGDRSRFSGTPNQ